MTPITGKERVSRQLQHKPVDSIAAHESFWSFTKASSATIVPVKVFLKLSARPLL